MVLTYVVSYLTVLSLSLSAAAALRNLCEASRQDLAAHVGAFEELSWYTGLDMIPVCPLILFSPGYSPPAELATHIGSFEERRFVP
jgi:hypothetical protein